MHYDPDTLLSTLSDPVEECYCPEHFHGREHDPSWDAHQARTALGIGHVADPPTPIAKEIENGEPVEGAAMKAGVWVSPTAAFPQKTMAHELAHHILGHVANHEDNTPIPPFRYITAEIEAECTAMLVAARMNTPHAILSARQYIQGYWPFSSLPTQVATRVKRAADQIYAAGASVQHEAQAA